MVKVMLRLELKVQAEAEVVIQMRLCAPGTAAPSSASNDCLRHEYDDVLGRMRAVTYIEYL
jgi:hypothetical protein